MGLPDEVYARLLELRTGLRQFERWSEQQAREAGLTSAQHQLLLSIRGHADPRGPTIGEVADYLLLRHHSVVGLVDRADAGGLVTRTRDSDDHRIVRLRLSRTGARRLEALSELHLGELERLAPRVPGAWAGLVGAHHDSPARIAIARVYGASGTDDGHRVLVDRLWPRGVARDAAPFDEWTKEVAPSAQLRTWYGHSPGRFAEFSRRYRAELRDRPAGEALQHLRDLAAQGRLTLMTATRDLDRSGAAVLRDVLSG